MAKNNIFTIGNMFRFRLYKETKNSIFLIKDWHISNIVRSVANYDKKCLIAYNNFFSKYIEDFLKENRLFEKMIEATNSYRHFKYLNNDFNSFLKYCEENKIPLTDMLLYFFSWRTPKDKYGFFWNDVNKKLTDMVNSILNREIVYGEQ